MPRLLILQSVWGLDRCPGFDIEVDLAAALEKVLAADFDGVGVNIARVDRTAIVARAMAERQAPWEAQAFVRDAGQLDGYMSEAARLGAHHLNVQLAGPVARFSDAVDFIDTLLPLVERAPLPIYFETHRGRLTNDLLFTQRLLEARPALRLTGDVSHYVVSGEMELPLRPDQLGAVDSLLGRCSNFHGRVAASHQVQVAMAAPQHRGWLDQHLAWWRRGFECWLETAGADGALTFMCELGPPPYAITAPDGSELSDRWQEAQMMRDLVRGIWRELTGEA